MQQETSRVLGGFDKDVNSERALESYLFNLANPRALDGPAVQKLSTYHTERLRMEAIEKHAPTKGDRFARRNFLNAIGVDMDENIPVDAPIAVKEKAITEAARKE